MCSAPAYVRFTPNSDRESGFPHEAMSALPLNADMCDAKPNVCFRSKRKIGFLRGNSKDAVRSS
jgi:hypothetical protein